MKNVFYFIYINSIGGVESFFYYLAQKYYNTNDIVVYYKFGNEEQIKRLSKYIDVRKYRGERIICDKIFFNYSLDIIDNVKAKEYIQIIHADYLAQGKLPDMNPKITKYIGVSQLACDSFRKLTGKEIELCYNPIPDSFPTNHVFHFISATRLTEEKGKGRIERFAKELDRLGIKYIWTIFTNDRNAIKNSNIIYMEPKLDIIDYIASSDFLIQLSDNESYCYSVTESLLVGTPVIITPCPVYKELGISEEQGYCIYIDFNFKELTKSIVDKLYKNLNTAFIYEPPEDSWDKILSPGQSSYVYDPNKPIDKEYVYLKPKKDYYDSELKRNVRKTEQPYITDREHAEELVNEDLGIIVVYKDKKKQDELLKFN